MKIYESEITDGLEEVISTNASVAYSTPVSIYIPSKKQKNVIQNLVVANEAVAENKDQFDLYYLNSVLVSTGWNKNDDVFHPQETWAAKDTPVDKQFNFMHDESDIIGHITGSLVVDQDGTEISDTSNAEKFDIITSAVIYNSWTNPELKERMTKIISEIEEGKWFVSMECLFNDFDYAVITPDDEHKVIARDDASAFLTKHLRAYGGNGKYEGYTVGRLLRNIAFSGKGLVSNPANPRSVILNDVESFAGTQAEEITNSNIYMETNHMSDVLKEQVEELKAELATAKEEAKALETEMTKQKEEEIQSKIEAFEAVVSEKDSAIAEAQAAVEVAEAKVAELEETIAKKDEELSEAKAKIEAHEAEVKTLARKAALVEAGATEEEVEETLAAFSDATDEMFEQVVALMKKKGNFPFKKKEDKEEDEEEALKKPKAEEVEAEEAEEAEAEETDEAEEEAEAEILEEVEEEAEAALTDAGDDSIEELRTSASDWLENNVLRSTASINK
tara:strand:- start:3085 stop:4599 length:1515 start_codon:yes stop_codon:yes gene_type:complete